jgi:hypothetical protein
MTSEVIHYRRWEEVRVKGRGEITLPLILLAGADDHSSLKSRLTETIELSSSVYPIL